MAKKIEKPVEKKPVKAKQAKPVAKAKPAKSAEPMLVLDL